MKSLPILTLLSGATLLPISPVALQLEPDAGTVLTKTLSASLQQSFDRLEVMMGGQPVPSEFLPEMDMEQADSRELSVTDEYVEVEDGRAIVLKRTYDDVGGERSESMSMAGFEGVEDTEYEGEAESELAEKTVRFEWNGDSESYSVAYPDDEDETPPSDLIADYDLTALLPEEEVEAGDSWTVDAEAIQWLFDIGGDLELEWDEDVADDSEPFEEDFGGELELTLESIEKEDGARIARIEVEGEVSFSESYESDLEQVPVVDGPGTEIYMTELELSGVLSWDLDLGALRALQLKGEGELATELSVDDPEPGQEFESTVFFDVEFEVEIAVEPED